MYAIVLAVALCFAAWSPLAATRAVADTIAHTGTHTGARAIGQQGQLLPSASPAQVSSESIQTEWPALWQANVTALDEAARNRLWLDISAIPGVREIQVHDGDGIGDGIGDGVGTDNAGNVVWQIWATREADAALRHMTGLTRWPAPNQNPRHTPTMQRLPRPRDAVKLVPNRSDAGGSITGIVKAEDSGLPLESVQIIATQLPSYASFYTNTDTAGVFTLSGLAAGTYVVQAYDYSFQYAFEFYGNTYDFNLATQLSIQDGITETINFSLTPGGAITGEVRASNTNAPLAGIYAYVTGPAPNYVVLNTGVTDSSGHYKIQGLPPSAAKVEFHDGNSARLYTDEYYNNRREQADADDVTVSSGVTTTNINATLDTSAILTGRFTDVLNGSPIASMSVVVYDYASNTFVRSASADASGYYRIGGLFAGSYKVCSGNTSTYLRQCYNNRPDTTSADALNLTSGVTTVLNMQLTTGSVITGRVTAAVSGAPLGSVIVRLLNPNTGSSLRSATTSASGYYTITGAAAGSYKLQFDGNAAGTGYERQYYDGKADLASADLITVGTSVTLTNYNAVLKLGSRIRGRVTAAESGAGLANVAVTVNGLNSSGNNSYSVSDADGYYTSTVLPAGSYAVYFYATNVGYQDSAYNHAVANQLVPVALPPMTTIVGINGVLHKGLSISGKVTDADTGAPIEGVTVEGYLGTNGYYNSTDYTAADGTYALRGLSTGTYRVRFQSPGSHALEWHDNASSFADSKPIVLVTDTANINAQLGSGAILTGRVTNANGDAIPASVCYTYYAGSSNVLQSADPDASGYYTTTSGLPAGRYQMQCQATNLTARWYGGASTQANAAIITVTNATTVSNINVLLATGTGSINGTALAADTNQPILGSVTLYDDAGLYITSRVLSAGSYTFSSLAAGNYRLAVNPTDRTYLSRYYPNKSTFAQSALVAVTNGVTTTASFIVPRSAQITGTVMAGALPIAGTAIYGTRVNTDGVSSSRTAYSSYDGSYIINGLEGGDFRVSFTPISPYLPQFYNNAQSSSTAQLVPLAAGGTATNINAALTDGATVRGKVTAQDSGLPLAYAYLYLFDSTSGYGVTAYSNSDGSYIFGGLRAGTYKLLITPADESFYLSEYYNDQPLSEVATSITVGAPGTTQSINIALASGGSVSGSVCDARTGAAIPYAYIWAEATDSSRATVYGSANSYGYFQLAAPNGNYNVLYSAGSLSNYFDEYFDNAPTAASATTITVSSGTTVRADACLAFKLRTYLPISAR